jgi:hypothetical protein
MRRLPLLIGMLALAASLLTVAARANGSHLTLRGPVVGVVDGVTIDVRVAGRMERVRVLGIDTPERGACYADRATAETARLALDRRVVLRGDRTQATRDRYGRLLAYVCAALGRRPRTLTAGGRLRTGRRRRQSVPADRVVPGLRARGAGGPARPVGSLRDVLDGRSPGRAAGVRDLPSVVPRLLRPPPPPDLDCRHFPQRQFRVRWDVPDPDPHRLDFDHDGVACES